MNTPAELVTIPTLPRTRLALYGYPARTVPRRE
jgi:hypothetical protein